MKCFSWLVVSKGPSVPNHRGKAVIVSHSTHGEMLKMTSAIAKFDSFIIQKDFRIQ
jgi:hypothetical protein